MRNPELKKLLTRIRIDLNISQKEMAKELGISATSLSQIESCLRNVPSVVADRIIEVYDLNDEEAEIIRQAVQQHTTRMDLLEKEVIRLADEVKRLERLILDQSY